MTPKEPRKIWGDGTSQWGIIISILFLVIYITTGIVLAIICF